MRPDALATSWLSMPWALDRRHIEAGVRRLATIDISPREAARMHRDSLAALIGQGEAEKRPYEVQDGVAVIPVHGMILKEMPFCFFGSACVTTHLVSRLEHAVGDPSVRAILLDVDSPGGQVAGTQEAGDAVAQADTLKPVFAAVRDMAASGAYWLASQARHVSANRTAIVGSIGVYMVADDVSVLYESKGVKTHVISSGGVKGAGVEGAAISAEALAEWQHEVDSLAALFIEAVASGRDMPREQAAALATGQCWIGEQARERGLVDSIENFADTFERARSA